MTTYNNNFTHDLEFGQMGEKSIARILELEHNKFEVKTERGDYDNPNSWVNTGNVAIEIECSDKPSGLKHTKADYWIHNFAINDIIVNTFIAPVPVLKELINSIPPRERPVVNGGDNNAAKMVLVKTKYLLDPFFLSKAYKKLYGQHRQTKCCVCEIEVLYLGEYIDAPDYCSDDCKDIDDKRHGYHSLPW